MAAARPPSGSKRSALIDTTPSWFWTTPSMTQRAHAEDDLPVLLEAAGGDDGVGEAGLVLDGDEDEPLGGPRPLPDDHHAGHPRAPPPGTAPRSAARVTP